MTSALSLGSVATIDVNPIAEYEHIECSGAEGSAQWYYFDLTMLNTEQVPMIQVSLSGGTGEAFMAVTHNQLPTTSDWEPQDVAACWGTTSCLIPFAEERVYVLMFGEAAFSDISLEWETVPTPWTTRKLCPFVIQTVTTQSPDDMNFWIAIEDWQLPHLRGLDILAWNDGHKLSIFNPELTCEVEDYGNAGISRCYYDAASGSLVAGFYYVHVFPKDVLGVTRTYDVNVLLRLHYAL